MKEPKHVKISVVIAAYNRPDYLKTAITSVINQTLPVDEIVIIDDCSSIDLRPVVNEFNNQNIIYFKKSENKGVSHSRNIGIQKATGDWIAFLDDDDAYLPNKIESNLCDISNNPSYSAVLCSYNYLESSGKAKSPKSGIVQARMLKKGNLFCGASGLFAKREFLLSELFDESIPLGEDWDLYIRLRKYGPVYFNNSPLYLYRKGHDSITSSAKKRTLSQIDTYAQSLYKHRTWLGESSFNIRLSNLILSYIAIRNKKSVWILTSIKRAGIKATCYVFYRKALSKLKGEKYYTC